MKTKTKLTALFLCVLMFLPMVFACGTKPVDNENGGADNSSNTNIEETSDIANTSDTSEVPTGDEPYSGTLIKDILESIKTGDYKKVAEYMMATDVEAYKFIQDMTVDSYEIVEEVNEDYSTYFKVKFNISQSDNEYFTVGESYWDLVIGGSMETVPLFRLSNDEGVPDYNGYHHYAINDKEYNFCYSFSHYLEIFATATDFNKVIVIKDGNWGTAHGVIHFYGSTAPESERKYPLSFDEIEDYMLKTTGITGIDYTVGGLYDKSNVSAICDAHGGMWLYCDLNDEYYNQDDNINVVIIDYYADAALLVVAKTVKYTFRENGDGTYKMLSTELIYDSGYEVQGGST